MKMKQLSILWVDAWLHLRLIKLKRLILLTKKKKRTALKIENLIQTLIATIQKTFLIMTLNMTLPTTQKLILIMNRKKIKKILRAKRMRKKLKNIKKISTSKRKKLPLVKLLALISQSSLRKKNLSSICWNCKRILKNYKTR